MIFQIFKTSDRGATSDTPPVPGAKKVTRERSGRHGATFRNAWWEVEVESIEDLLELCKKTVKKPASGFQIVLQIASYPYDREQPDYSLEIVDDWR